MQSTYQNFPYVCELCFEVKNNSEYYNNKFISFSYSLFCPTFDAYVIIETFVFALGHLPTFVVFHLIKWFKLDLERNKVFHKTISSDIALDVVIVLRLLLLLITSEWRVFEFLIQ